MVFIFGLLIISFIVTPQTIAVTPPTVTPLQSTVGCTALQVISGNNEIVPSNIKFKATASNDTASDYRFYFGDSKQQESKTPEVTHRYDVSGTFTVIAQVRSPQGTWNTKDTCESQVVVKPIPVIESHRSSCSNVFITSGNNELPPTTATMRVTGYDNKGAIKNYRLEYGDGTVVENTSGLFEKRYDTAGTYVIRGFIQDSEDKWVGGENKCKTSLYVNTTAMTEQPKTGTPTMITILGIGAGFTSLVLFELKKRLR